MRLLVEYSHPAQVHKFKHLLRGFIAEGHGVLILSRDKDIMLPLLDDLALPHVCISKARKGKFGRAFELIQRELATFYHFIRFKPSIVLSAHSVAITHIGWLFRVPRVVHDDTEHATLQQSLYMPFASHIITSTAYTKDWGPRQIRINSLEPLAYLHPNVFTPDPGVLTRYGLSRDMPFAVVRLVSWDAAHDIHHRSRANVSEEQHLNTLLESGIEKIVLSSERGYKVDRPEIIRVDPSDFHHVLSFASVCITEGGSVANESAVLGTPTVLFSPLQSGLFNELEKYRLLIRTDNAGEAFAKASELIRLPQLRNRWKDARRKLLIDKADMSGKIAEALIRIASGSIHQVQKNE